MTELGSVPNRDAWAYVGALVIRLRWRVQQVRYRVLRNQPRVRLGEGGRLNIRARASISFGPGCELAAGYYVSVQGALQVGSEFYANRDAFVSCMHGVEIGDRVRFGERVSVHDENHVFEPVDVRDRGGRHQYRTRPVVIGDDVWLGANVVVLPGARIGANTVVAANSVVRGELPADVLAGGNPAAVIRSLAGSAEPTA